MLHVQCCLQVKHQLISMHAQFEMIMPSSHFNKSSNFWCTDCLIHKTFWKRNSIYFGSERQTVEIKVNGRSKYDRLGRILISRSVWFCNGRIGQILVHLDV